MSIGVNRGFLDNVCEKYGSQPGVCINLNPVQSKFNRQKPKRNAQALSKNHYFIHYCSISKKDVNCMEKALKVVLVIILVVFGSTLLLGLFATPASAMDLFPRPDFNDSVIQQGRPRGDLIMGSPVNNSIVGHGMQVTLPDGTTRSFRVKDGVTLIFAVPPDYSIMHNSPLSADLDRAKLRADAIVEVFEPGNIAPNLKLNKFDPQELSGVRYNSKTLFVTGSTSLEELVNSLPAGRYLLAVCNNDENLDVPWKAAGRFATHNPPADVKPIKRSFIASSGRRFISNNLPNRLSAQGQGSVAIPVQLRPEVGGPGSVFGGIGGSGTGYAGTSGMMNLGVPVPPYNTRPRPPRVGGTASGDCLNTVCPY
jgi:hypothetical protein